MNKKLPIDDDRVLSHWYDSRTKFIVDYNPDLVEVRIEKSTIRFLLRQR